MNATFKIARIEFTGTLSVETRGQGPELDTDTTITDIVQQAMLSIVGIDEVPLDSIVMPKEEVLHEIIHQELLRVLNATYAPKPQPPADEAAAVPLADDTLEGTTAEPAPDEISLENISAEARAAIGRVKTRLGDSELQGGPGRKPRRP